MSQTPNFNHPTVCDCFSPNRGDSKITDDLSDISTVKRGQTQIKLRALLSAPRRNLTSKAQVLTLLVAIVALLLAANRTYADDFTNQSAGLIAQAQPTRDTPIKVRTDSPGQVSLTLAIEIVVATFLLIGLLAAFLANRAMRSVKTVKSEANRADNPASTASETTILDSPLQLANPSTSSFALAPTPLSEQQVEAEADQTKLLTEITLRLRQSQYLDDLLRTAVKEVRRTLKADRVIIYSLDPHSWEGTVIAESVTPGWPQILRVRLNDPCFRDRHLEKYQQGQVTAINDIYQEPRVTECYRRMLEQFAVKANLVAPIVKNNQLLGLLIAHQCSAPRVWEHSDIDLFSQLAIQVGFAIDQVSFLEQQESEAERAQILTEITLRIRESQSLEDLLKTAVKEVRRALKTDRTVIFGLDPTDWSGIIVAESVTPGWPQTLRVRIDDPCLRDQHMEMYKQGQVTAINDIYQEPRVTECYRQMLEQFVVRANLVAPILKNNQLLGLLIAHQCSAPRVWEQADINLFAQLATQVGFAVDQLSLVEQLETEELLKGLEEAID